MIIFLILILSCNMILFTILRIWKRIQKNITNVISETKQDYEALDERIDVDAAEEADNEMEDTTEIA